MSDKVGIVTHWMILELFSSYSEILCCDVRTHPNKGWDLTELCAELPSFQQFAPGVAVSFQLHPIQLSRRKWKLNLVVTQSQRNPGKGRTGEQSLWWDWDHYQSQCCRIPALPLHNLLNFKITAENWRIPQPQSFAESPESRVGLHLPWLCQVVFQAVGSTTCRTPHKIPFMWPFQVKTPHCQLIQQVKLEAAFWLHLKFLPSCF